MKKILLIFLINIFSNSAFAEEIYLEPEEFINQTFPSGAPEEDFFVLEDNEMDEVYDLIGDTYHTPLISFWEKEGKVAYILEMIGKHEFITAGYVVKNNEVVDAKILVYREKYGWEVRFDSFLKQIRGQKLNGSKLTKGIYNISGATMSVDSMRELTKLSLFLYKKVIK